MLFDIKCYIDTGTKQCFTRFNIESSNYENWELIHNHIKKYLDSKQIPFKHIMITNYNIIDTSSVLVNCYSV